MEESAAEDVPLEDEGAEDEVEADGGVAVLAEEGHQVAEAAGSNRQSQSQ